MEDAINATIRLMEVDYQSLKLHTGYNIMGVSVSPDDLANSIRKHIPDFNIDYAPDFRQEIAMTWPESLDDSLARMHDDWKPLYNLEQITEIMLKEIRKKEN
jgi:nucleoside-diphosphate-sugar epimerase